MLDKPGLTTSHHRCSYTITDYKLAKRALEPKPKGGGGVALPFLDRVLPPQQDNRKYSFRGDLLQI